MADETTEISENWDERIAYLRGLSEIVRDLGLSKLKIEANGMQISLKNVVPTLATAAPNFPIAAQIPVAVSAPIAAKNDVSLSPVVSPMIGVFYRAPAPGEPNFVEIGDSVEAGQTIGLVEAMKVFNEIAAESGGVVAKIEAQTGELVETGAPLIFLRR